MTIREISPLRSEWINKYVSKESDVHSLYSHAPLSEGVFFQRAAEIDLQGLDLERKMSLAQVMQNFHAPDLLHPAVKRNLVRFCMPESLVVIGGHQACLLSGPLYTIYKAITIIQLAKREEKRLGRPVVPVFWIAGEDHDWDEVNHLWIQDDTQKPEKVRYSPGHNRKPISSIWVDPERMHPWLEELGRRLPDSYYKPEWLPLLKKFSEKPISWTRFFAKVMMYLFERSGLLLIDSADPALRRLERPFLEILIKKNRKIQRLIENAHKHVMDVDGAHKPDFAHLFYYEEGQRYPLYFDGEEWSVRGVDRRWDTLEILDLARRYPEKLSNNVLTRPLMQEYLFSSLAFVGGSSEVAYWGLLRDVFSECDLTMPIVYPRIQVTLVPPAAGKRMKQLNISIQDAVPCLQHKKEEWLRSQYSSDIEYWVRQAKNEMMLIHEKLCMQLEQEARVNLVEFGQVNRNKLVLHLDYLQKYTENALSSKYQAEIRQWDELFHTLSPLGNPQERTYNLIQYWNKYGLGWLEQLLKNPLSGEGDKAYAVSL